MNNRSKKFLSFICSVSLFIFVAIASAKEKSIGYVHVTTDPADAQIKVDLGLRRAQSDDLNELEAKITATEAEIDGDPVPLIRNAKSGDRQLIVRTTQGFWVGNTISIQRSVSKGTTDRKSHHRIVHVGEVDALPAIFIYPPISGTFNAGRGEISDPNTAQIFRIKPTQKTRMMPVEVVPPAHLTRSVEAGSDRIQIEVPLVHRNDFPKGSVVLVQQIDKYDDYVKLARPAKAGDKELFIEINSQNVFLGKRDAVSIRQGTLRFEAEVERSFPKLGKIIVKPPLPSELKADEAKIYRVKVSEVAEIEGIPEKEIRGARGKQTVFLTLLLKGKLKRGFDVSSEEDFLPPVQVFRLSKVEVEKDFHLPERRNVLVRKDEITEIPELKLRRGTGNITIISDPAGANITLVPQFKTEREQFELLNQQHITPITLMGVPAGEYRLKLAIGSYSLREAGKSVALTSGQIEELNNCQCSSNLRSRLSRVGIELSEDLLVVVKENSTHWQISDNAEKRSYSVRREGDSLNILPITIIPVGGTAFVHRELQADEQAPMLLQNGFQINGGALQTSARNVTLNFAVSDDSTVHEMMLSNNPDFSGATWESYTPSKLWELTAHPGSKEVWVKFRDRATNETKSYVAKIELTSPPGMVYIAHTKIPFLMGNENGDADEKPAHEVRLSAYYIDQFEVTNEQYKEFIDATAHKPPPYWVGNNYPVGMANYPVVFISWNSAKSYAKWIGKELPTEAEWERAALGSSRLKLTRSKWSWGNRWDGLITNMVDIHDGSGLMPVDRFPQGRSEDQLYNMCGNVWEWTSDWYSSTFYSEIGIYTDIEDMPIHGPEQGNEKVIRGGLSLRNGKIEGLTNREKIEPNGMYGGVGFRCVMPINEE